MRIAFRISTVGAALCAIPLLVGFANLARATDIPAPPPPAALATSTSGTTATAAPSTQVASAADPGSIAAAVPPVVTPPVAKTESPAKPPGVSLAEAESKLPDSVSEVMKHLNKSGDDVTLDDLNSARQAVAKIEILIDLEKHLAELDKIKQERQKGTSMASMIPASALQPTAMMQAPSNNGIGSMPPMMPPREALDVTQIAGGGGHYNATIKMTGDESKTVHVGDHLSDGSSVFDISATQVVLERDGVKRTLRVKNVDTVFGNSF